MRLENVGEVLLRAVAAAFMPNQHILTPVSAHILVLCAGIDTHIKMSYIIITLCEIIIRISKQCGTVKNRKVFDKIKSWYKTI
jgi:hypothetical protein